MIPKLKSDVGTIGDVPERIAGQRLALGDSTAAAVYAMGDGAHTIQALNGSAEMNNLMRATLDVGGAATTSTTPVVRVAARSDVSLRRGPALDANKL